MPEHGLEIRSGFYTQGGGSMILKMGGSMILVKPLLWWVHDSEKSQR